MNNKQTSLPKIKRDHSQSIKNKETQRINKQIHKSKWGLAPKCLIAGHQGKDVLYVCINPSCQQSTRLVCEMCFYKNHSKHNQQFLAVDEIKSGQINKLRYWPFQNKFQKIFQFVTKHQIYVNNMIQDVNATFNGMALRIINSVDMIRLNLLKKIDTFYIKQTVKKQFCEKVKQQLEQCFTIKKIKQQVRMIFNKQQKHQIFLNKMKKLLNDQQVIKNRQKFYQFFINSQKGHDMYFDKMYFLKKQNWIIEQIQQQKKTLRQTQVTIDQFQLGLQKIIPQTIAYLQRQSQGHLPLTFDKKELQDGSEYIGFLQKGDRTMFGMRKYKNGYVYYGEWRINAKNGWGIYQNKTSGYKYAGSWKQDKRNGFGRQQTLTTIYEGNYLGDKKQGFGIWTQDGIRYQITWKNDKKHGTGKKILKNGQQVNVYYLNGVQSSSKSNKSISSLNLSELSKRFGSKSIDIKTQSN